MSESSLQAECFQWAWNEYPNLRRLLFHVPNGGNRNVLEAMKFKGIGVIAGIPDLILLRPLCAFELKYDRNKKTKDQDKIKEIWAGVNIPIYEIRNFEEFKELFNRINGAN